MPSLCFLTLFLFFPLVFSLFLSSSLHLCVSLFPPDLSLSLSLPISLSLFLSLVRCLSLFLQISATFALFRKQNFHLFLRLFSLTCQKEYILHRETSVSLSTIFIHPNRTDYGQKVENKSNHSSFFFILKSSRDIIVDLQSQFHCRCQSPDKTSYTRETRKQQTNK